MVTRKAPKSDRQAAKIDWGVAWTGWGFGIACMLMGVLVFWAASTGGAGGPSGNALRTSQRIVALLPNNVKQWLALGVSVLMFLGGIFLFVMGCYGVIMDIRAGRK